MNSKEEKTIEALTDALIYIASMSDEYNTVEDAVKVADKALGQKYEIQQDID